MYELGFGDGPPAHEVPVLDVPHVHESKGGGVSAHLVFRIVLVPVEGCCSHIAAVGAVDACQQAGE